MRIQALTAILLFPGGQESSTTVANEFGSDMLRHFGGL